MIENLKYEFEDIESVEQLEDFDDEYVDTKKIYC